MEKVTHLNSYRAVPRKGVSWRAIFAGTLTVLSILLVLNLIGLAIGLSTIEPTEETDPLSGLGTGSIIWWVLSNLIALFAGGFVAARVGVSFTSKSGIIQGIMTWALYTIISAWLLTTVIGSIISGVGNVVGNVLSTTGQVIGDQLSPVIENQLEDLDVSWREARNEFRQLLSDSGREELDPEGLERDANRYSTQVQSGAEVDQVFREARNRLDQSYEAVDKQALVNILVERTDMNEAEAQRTVDNMLSRYENLREDVNAFMDNAKESANRHAENAAKAISQASIYLAIALILGIIVAATGGFMGVKNMRDDYMAHDYVADDRNEVGYREEF